MGHYPVQECQQSTSITRIHLEVIWESLVFIGLLDLNNKLRKNIVVPRKSKALKICI